MASEGDPKKLSELRVIDLKAELEKRSIDQSGVKAVLVKKLHKALTDEGEDPETYVFHITEKTTPAKKMKKENEEDTEGNEGEKEDGDSEKIEDKQESENDSAVSLTAEGINLSMDEMQVKDEIFEENVQGEKTQETAEKKDESSKEEDKTSGDNKKGDVKVSKEESKVKKEENKVKKEASTEEKPKSESAKEKTKQQTSGDNDSVKTKVEPPKMEEKPDANGLDAEDSINLMIGEDEKLLAEEEESNIKEEKEAKERGTNKKSSDSGTRKGEKRANSPSEKASDDKGKKQSDYRNLWVSGLSSVTRATDLKHLFSKLGKVVAAKVVTNAKTPGARCYGFVTMATSEDATKCIKGLNLTELHGRFISVEAAKRDSSGQLKKPESSPQVANKPAPSSKKPEGKRKAESSPRSAEDAKKKKRDSENIVPPGTEDMVEENGEETKRKEDNSGGERSRDRERRDGSNQRGRERTRSRDESRDHNAAARGGKASPGVLSFAQIKEERERQRLREKERALREEERRRREERERQREVERRQREEALRLEREREKIRIERERLERERAELLKMERDRLEREKEDLKRQQMKLEEARRGKRTLSSSRDSYEERKRPTNDSRRYEGGHHSGSPRFESHRPSSEYKKESTSRREGGMDPTGSRSRYEEVSRSRREEPPPRSKEGHYTERGRGGSGSGYRGGRDERDRRPDESSHMPKSDASNHRYQSGGETWSSGSMSKGFPTVVSGRETWAMSGPDRKGPDMSPWARPPAQPDRWVTGNSMSVSGRGGGGGGGMYPPVGAMGGGGPSMPMPISGSPYQPSDRYDAYKPMASLQRKY